MRHPCRQPWSHPLKQHRSHLLRKPDSLVGLDIGSTSVKLLELSKRDGRHCVEAFGVEPLPPNAVVDRHISDLDSIGEAIRRLADRTRPRARRAAAAVPDSAAITRIVEMDASLSDDALQSRIAAEAGRHIPFPLQEVALDFEVQNLSERNPEQVEVLLAACRREEVEKRESAMRLGGFRPHVVDIEAHALHRASLRIPHAAGDSAHGASGRAVLGVLDIGANAMRLHVFDSAKSVYSREQRLGASRASARAQRPDLVAEAVRALRLFQASNDRPVRGVLLAGGAAGVPGLANDLAGALAAPARVADPCAGMSLAPRVDADGLRAAAPVLLTACGLALRAFDR